MITERVGLPRMRNKRDRDVEVASDYEWYARLVGIHNDDDVGDVGKL